MSPPSSGCFMMVSFFAYFSTLNMEATCSPGTLVGLEDYTALYPRREFCLFFLLSFLGPLYFIFVLVLFVIINKFDLMCAVYLLFFTLNYRLCIACYVYLTRSRDSSGGIETSLRAGWPRNRGLFSSTSKIPPKHLDRFWGLSSEYRWWSDKGVNLTIHFQPALRFRKHRAMLPFPHASSCRAA
jgi:hypothetical protein